MFTVVFRAVNFSSCSSAPNPVLASLWKVSLPFHGRPFLRSSMVVYSLISLPWFKYFREPKWGLKSYVDGLHPSLTFTLVFLSLFLIKLLWKNSLSTACVCSRGTGRKMWEFQNYLYEIIWSSHAWQIILSKTTGNKNPLWFCITYCTSLQELTSLLLLTVTTTFKVEENNLCSTWKTIRILAIIAL